MATSDAPRWLSPAEKEAWTGLVSLVLLLPGRLEAPLQQESGLTLFEYLTLSHISEAPERRLRMSELAYLANGSLSRLSNVVKRFEQRAWVERSPDPDDGRYTLVTLTDAGFTVVQPPPRCTWTASARCSTPSPRPTSRRWPASPRSCGCVRRT